MCKNFICPLLFTGLAQALQPSMTTVWSSPIPKRSVAAKYDNSGIFPSFFRPLKNSNRFSVNFNIVGNGQ